MNFPHLRLKALTRFLLFTILFYSCTKIVTTEIGSDLIPPVDDVTTKDTIITLTTKNLGYDTVSVGLSDDHVLGYINDPVFGTTSATINFQVAPETIPLALDIPKDSVVVDSVVLCLKYNGVWGDTLQPLEVRVYSMDPEVVFNKNIAYNNTVQFTKGPELTESNTAKVVNITNLDDIDTTKGFYTEVMTNQLRIRLNKSFGEKIVAADSATNYSSDSAFYNLLRGLIVEPDASGQALIRMNLTDTTTRLTLYYHNAAGGDTLSKRFVPQTVTSGASRASANCNTILRKYNGTQIPAYVNRPDSNQDLIFMQTSPGTKAFINVSQLQEMRNVIVHRAEVLMYQVPDASDKYLTPPNLFLAAYSTDSARQFSIPYDLTFSNGSISNLSTFGVAPKLKNGSYYYSFDISRYVQGIVTRGDTLYNLVLSAPYNQYITPIEKTTLAYPISSPVLNSVAIGRVRLGGGNNNNPQYKMKLHIVYSLQD